MINTAITPSPTPPRLAAAQPESDASGAAKPLPYRQDDPTWGHDVMWDRDLVIKADTKLNGESRTQAESLMREFEDGNTIANEGCLITSMAMVLRLLSEPGTKVWTPRNLNHEAQKRYYYTPCGLSMAQLNADLLSETTSGKVQLTLKEEYLSGVPSWPKMRCDTSALVRAYRSLPEEERKNHAVILKIGTYDDTVASHYLLLDPADSGSVNDDNPLVLDPAKPFDETKPDWRLRDSSNQIVKDPEIAKAWKESGIEPTQICGAWVYSRFNPSGGAPQSSALVKAWARELETAASSFPRQMTTAVAARSQAG